MAEMSPELFAEIETLEQRHADHPQGRYFVPLANAYRKAGRVEQAETLVRDGLQHHPEYLSAHIVLGRCLRDRGATAEAESTFRRVLDTDSQNLVALRSLGELAAAEGRTDEARQWLERLVAVDPLNEEARSLLDEVGADEAEVEVAAGDGFRIPDDASDEESAGSGMGLESGDDGQGAPSDSLLELDPTLDAGADEVQPLAPEGLDTFEPVESEVDETFDLEADLELAHEPSADAAGETDAVSDQDTGDDLGLITFDGPLDLDDASLSGGAPGGLEPTSLEKEGVGDAGPDRWDGEDDLDLDTADDPHAAAAGEAGDAELATRTMADLYARQGFHDRAAEVYRRLLREGGDDPELRQRLDECEAAMAGAGSEPAGEEGQDDADAFADSFADGFVTADAVTDESARDDEAGVDDADDPHELDIDALERAFGEPDDAQAGEGDEEAAPGAPAADADTPDRLVGDASTGTGVSETIGAYLARLASWSPGDPAEPVSEGPPEGDAPVAADEASPEAPPTDVGEAEPAPWEVTPEPVEPVHEEETDEGFLPWEEPAATGEAETTAPDLEPWEEPVGLDSEVADASAPGPDGDPGAAVPQDDGDEPAEGGEPAEDELPFERYFAAEEEEPEPASAEETRDAETASADADEDDDDLESFQAWLQSLKT